MFGTETISAYLLVYAKSHMFKSLGQGIRKGSLEVTDGDEHHVFGNKMDKPAAKIIVKNVNFWYRIFVQYELGFSEAFMNGDFDTPDLKAILDLWILNRHELSSFPSIVSRSISTLSALYIRFFGQSLSNSKQNVSTGYDCSNKFFESFLSQEMTYSCANWPDSIGGVRGDLEETPSFGDLEAAQLTKIHHLLKKARLRKGDRVLEFGSGWGSMSIEAAKLGCKVDTVTLSVQQKIGAEERIKAAGLEKQITVHLLDYRNLPAEFENAFDAFVSVEMVEAVGYKYLEKFFQILDWALKPDRAYAVIASTTIPESRYNVFQVNDYIRKYQWPNTFCPSVTSFLQTAEKAVEGRFSAESVEDYTHHYPRTLREWGRRFEKNWNDATMEALLKDQPQLAEGNNLENFKRKWQYMFVHTAAAYSHAYTTMHYFTFVRPGHIAQICD